MPLRITLLHGVATTAGVWSRVAAELATRGHDDVVAIERPCTGSLRAEVAELAPLVAGSLVVGQSGGATLVLALAASPARLAGGIAHEPAVGSLRPGLLGPFAAAYEQHGAAGFGAALYGASWSPALAGEDPGAVARELSMFGAFEPESPRAGQGPVLVTVGSASPAPRHEAAAALHQRLGYPVETLAGAEHFAAWDAPGIFADAIAGFAARLGDAVTPPSRSGGAGRRRVPRLRP